MSTYIRLLASYSPYIANQKDCVCVLTYVRLADIRGFAINSSLSHISSQLLSLKNVVLLA